MGVDFSKNALGEFLRKLGSSSPAPGGGAAAAVTAALGAALLEMTAGIHKKRRTDWVAKASVKRFGLMRRRFLDLAGKDAQAFASFSKISKLKKETPRYQRALKNCAAPPWEVIGLSAAGLRLARRLTRRTSRWLASDLAEGALLLRTAFSAARWNLEINLRGIQDKKYVRKIYARLDRLETESRQHKNQILKELGL